MHAKSRFDSAKQFAKKNWKELTLVTTTAIVVPTVLARRSRAFQKVAMSNYLPENHETELATALFNWKFKK